MPGSYGERKDDSGKSSDCSAVAPAVMVTAAVADVVRAVPLESSSAVSVQEPAGNDAEAANDAQGCMSSDPTTLPEASFRRKWIASTSCDVHDAESCWPVTSKRARVR